MTDAHLSKDNPSPGTGTDTGSAGPSLKESAANLAREQQKVGAERLSGIAGAVHAAADELERQVPGTGDYIHDAATRLDTMADGLRDRSLSELADGMRQLGRERPLALFGGAVLAGFAVSRFLKSGERQDSPARRDRFED